MGWASRCSVWRSFLEFFTGYTRLAISKAREWAWRLCSASFGSTAAGFGRKRSSIKERPFPSRSVPQGTAQANNRNFRFRRRYMSHEVEILLVEDSQEDAELTIRVLRRNKLA